MHHIPLLGNLRQDADIPAWWMSSPVAVPFCTDQALPFTIMLGAEEIPDAPDIVEAVRAFLNLTDHDRLAISGRVFRHYRDFVSQVPENELDVVEPEKIWGHVRPTDVFVSRYSDGDGAVYVRLCCDCDWEEEHGLQLVFRNGSALTLVGAHEDGAFVE